MILEYPSKQENIVVLSGVCLDGCHNGTCPVKDQLLQPISLIEKREHVLLHGLPGLPISQTLLIVLPLLVDNLIDQLFGLFQ
jgi:hypothetical protein